MTVWSTKDKKHVVDGNFRAVSMWFSRQILGSFVSDKNVLLKNLRWTIKPRPLKSYGLRIVSLFSYAHRVLYRLNSRRCEISFDDLNTIGRSYSILAKPKFTEVASGHSAPGHGRLLWRTRPKSIFSVCVAVWIKGIV